MKAAPARARRLGDPSGRWHNFGDWTHTTDYAEAAAALARRHADAIQLNAQDRTLELAAGMGGGWSVWQTYGVTHLTACDRVALPQPLPEGVTAVQQCFDAPGPLTDRFSALLLVDAAYHARSPLALAHQTAQWARPGARWVWSTLLIEEPLPRTLAYVLRAAGVPWASQVGRRAWTQALTATGWSAPDIMPLPNVLSGFAAHIRRGTARSWGKDAVVLKASARLCQALHDQPGVSYALLQATYQSSSTTSTMRIDGSN